MSVLCSDLTVEVWLCNILEASFKKVGGSNILLIEEKSLLTMALLEKHLKLCEQFQFIAWFNIATCSSEITSTKTENYVFQCDTNGRDCFVLIPAFMDM